jgi:hypothetical protein
VKLIEPGCFELCAALPCGDDHCNAVNLESTSREQDRIDRGAVEPLHVVDGNKHVGVLCGNREQSEGRGADR